MKSQDSLYHYSQRLMVNNDIANVFMFNNNNEKYQIQRHDFDIIGESTNIIRRKSDGVIINIIS